MATEVRRDRRVGAEGTALTRPVGSISLGGVVLAALVIDANRAQRECP